MRCRDDVVDQALRCSTPTASADLTCGSSAPRARRPASTLYHHFATKQLLLAAVADEILAPRPHPPGWWDDRVAAVCSELRDAVLAYRDGAEVVATSYSVRARAAAPYDDLVASLAEAGLGSVAGADRGPDPAPLRPRARDRRADPPAGRERRGHRR